MGHPLLSAGPDHLSTRRVSACGAEPHASGLAAGQPGEPALPGGAASHGPQHTPILHQGGAAGPQAALSQQYRGMAAAGPQATLSQRRGMAAAGRPLAATLSGGVNGGSLHSPELAGPAGYLSFILAAVLMG